jgi:hypothetical protein
MPEKKGEYSIFLMWCEEYGTHKDGWRLIEVPEIFNHYKLMKKSIISDLDYANKRYPKLEIDKKPIFIIFDRKGIVFRTHDITEAVEFLEEKLPGDF